MAILLVPHTVTQNSVNLWLGATDTAAKPANFDIAITGRGPVLVPQAGWRPVTAGGSLPANEQRTWVQVVTVTGLEPGTPLRVELGENRIRFATLPQALPPPNTAPFTVLLGSCYAVHHDNGVGSLAKAIGQQVRPAVKILCGDQVYLDQNGVFPSIPFRAANVARAYLAKYLRNWSDPQGFGRLLSEGATWFTPDDHEYWNNSPNPATLHLATFFEGRRDTIKNIARSLLADFQSDGQAEIGQPRQFEVGRLSFFVTDMRSDRGRGDATLQSPQGHDATIRWIDGLRGPGVLVVSQPVFEKAAGFLGSRLVDRTLPNYRDQYPALANALLRAPHSVLILTGDVHYGRVARTTGIGERAIWEVIASPAALVALCHPRTESAPAMFPAESTGPPQVATRTLDESRRAGDNLVTVGFTEASGVVHVEVRQWYVRDLRSPQPVPIRFTLV